MNQQVRQLTSAEAKVVDLVKLFYKAAEDRKVAITLHGAEDAANVITTLVDKRTLQARVIWDGNKKRYNITFMLTDFYRYILFMLKQVGLRLQLDGSLKTFDNLTITNEYLQ